MGEVFDVGDWPVDLIRASLDQPVPACAPAQVRAAIVAAGYGPKLARFLSELYTCANGGSFYDGAFRIIPLEGRGDGETLGLFDWNRAGDWQEYAPANARSIFYFCMNAFGDLLGVPIDGEAELAADRVAVLWLEEARLEIFPIGWSLAVFRFLKDIDHVGGFLARLREYEWAVGFLGKPEPDQCFSWKMPPIVGGEESIRNLEIAPAYIHVSFTLQVIREAQQRR